MKVTILLLSLMSGKVVCPSGLKGDQRNRVEKPIPSSSLPAEAAEFGLGHRLRKEGVSYTNQVRFSGEIDMRPLLLSSQNHLYEVA